MLFLVKSLLKKIIPGWVFSLYHYLWAVFSAVVCGWPSHKMAVIGITGTKGKTSTANFIWATLQAGGKKTGIITTANIRIGDKEVLNNYHMTMPGRFVIQQLLAQMVRADCKYCVVEVTSEGIKQFRHKGIEFDIAIFTNLTPEHLPSHGGSFEKYKAAKGKLFESLYHGEKKIIDGKRIEQTIIANRDDENAGYFLNFNAEKKITFGLKPGADYVADNIKDMPDGAEFSAGGAKFELSILGGFNVYNALPAVIIGRLFKIPDMSIARGLKELTLIPGRMERIDEGQNFTVIVDYAHEKESMTAALKTARDLANENKVIVLLGGVGGGRDKSQRPKMGKAAAEKADYVIVSNVDPYDDEPAEICEDVARAAEEHSKIRNQNLFVIEDRRLGIRKAFELARQNDVVIITGKGHEQSMIIGRKSIKWNDKEVVIEELKKLKA